MFLAHGLPALTFGGHLRSMGNDRFSSFVLQFQARNEKGASSALIRCCTAVIILSQVELLSMGTGRITVGSLQNSTSRSSLTGMSRTHGNWRLKDGIG